MKVFAHAFGQLVDYGRRLLDIVPEGKRTAKVVSANYDVRVFGIVIHCCVPGLTDWLGG